MRLDFRTVRRPSRYEPERTKGSRFFASIAPVQDIAAAEAHVAALRAEFRDATHHCFAWRLGHAGEDFRSSDDGEPSGSAGRPILLQIEGHDLTNTAVVVTRYFGGTKLGVGGLMRAYGGACGQALDRAEIEVVQLKQTLHVEHPYECTGTIESILKSSGLTPLGAEYGERVSFRLAVPLDRVESLCTELRDRTAGLASFRLNPLE